MIRISGPPTEETESAVAFLRSHGIPFIEELWTTDDWARDANHGQPPRPYITDQHRVVVGFDPHAILSLASAQESEWERSAKRRWGS